MDWCRMSNELRMKRQEKCLVKDIMVFWIRFTQMMMLYQKVESSRTSKSAVLYNLKYVCTIIIVLDWSLFCSSRSSQLMGTRKDAQNNWTWVRIFWWEVGIPPCVSTKSQAKQAAANGIKQWLCSWLWINEWQLHRFNFAIFKTRYTTYLYV